LPGIDYTNSFNADIFIHKKQNMKTILSVTVISLTLGLISCKSKSSNDATQLAKDIQSTVKEHTPGAVATSETGYYMKAKIDGKQWNAAFMIPDLSETSSYKTVHGETGETYINFMLWRQGIKPGNTETLDDSHVANLSVEGLDGFWGGKKGEIKITAMTDQWLEGSFNFDATSSSDPGKTIAVTEGSFRVPTNNVAQ
jgi:hypothetical protein